MRHRKILQSNLFHSSVAASNNPPKNKKSCSNKSSLLDYVRVSQDARRSLMRWEGRLNKPASPKHFTSVKKQQSSCGCTLFHHCIRRNQNTLPTKKFTLCNTQRVDSWDTIWREWPALITYHGCSSWLPHIWSQLQSRSQKRHRMSISD